MKTKNDTGEIESSIQSTGLGQSAGQDSKGPATKKNPAQKDPTGEKNTEMIEPEDTDADIDPSTNHDVEDAEKTP